MDLLWILFSNYMTNIRRDHSFINSPEIHQMWKDNFSDYINAPADEQKESIRFFLLQLNNCGR